MQPLHVWCVALTPIFMHLFALIFMHVFVHILVWVFMQFFVLVFTRLFAYFFMGLLVHLFAYLFTYLFTTSVHVSRAPRPGACFLLHFMACWLFHTCHVLYAPLHVSTAPPCVCPSPHLHLCRALPGRTAHQPLLRVEARVNCTPGAKSDEPPPRNTHRVPTHTHSRSCPLLTRRPAAAWLTRLLCKPQCAGRRWYVHKYCRRHWGTT